MDLLKNNLLKIQIYDYKPVYLTINNTKYCSMKLIPMTDFVLQFEGNKETVSDENKAFTEAVLKYAEFLKQPLELWMFVPCDINKRIIDKPEKNMFSTLFDYQEALLEYENGQASVLFEGFSIHSEYGENNIINIGVNLGLCLSEGHNLTIENITKDNIILTPTGIKLLGL